MPARGVYRPLLPPARKRHDSRGVRACADAMRMTPGAGRSVRDFGIMLAVFLGLNAVSWPILLSFRLWVLQDRSSFLNLSYLLDEGRILGVDTYYSYGLLPVLLQEVLFRL